MRLDRNCYKEGEERADSRRGQRGGLSTDDRGKPAFSAVNSPTVPKAMRPAAAPTVANEASTFLTTVTGRTLPTRITLRHDGGGVPPGRGTGFTRSAPRRPGRQGV
jgi:hypothetical protein